MEVLLVSLGPNKILHCLDVNVELEIDIEWILLFIGAFYIVFTLLTTH